LFAPISIVVDPNVGIGNCGYFAIDGGVLDGANTLRSGRCDHFARLDVVAGFDARSAWRDDPLERRIRAEWDTNELRREGFRGFGFHFAVLPVFDFEDVDPLLSERVVRDGIAVQHEHTVRPLSNPELRRWFLDRKAPSR